MNRSEPRRDAVARLLLACVLLSSAVACRQQADAPLAAQAVATQAGDAPAQAEPASVDPLPSWRDGANKQAIIDYVSAAVVDGGPGHVPPEARFAIFDNDGTLWAEQPIVQLEFVGARVAEAAKRDPDVASDPAVKALAAKNLAFFQGKDGEKHAMALLALVSSGMSPDTYASEVDAFFASARHPTLDVPYRQTTYKPMIELLQYLRANGFQTWIGSGGGIDFMRPISSEFYGIPPEQVIGSSGSYDVELVDGKVEVLKSVRTGVVNDHEGKVAGLLAHAGKVPVFVAGNVRSGGDVPQLMYSQASPHPSFQLLVNHDDAEREFAYQEDDGASLAAAEAGGWHVVSIRDDWEQVFTDP
ncbi:HAD family hydrolase [Luteimonas kalidii]|uniref:HAD family hydrolase n=1 Tax=Luteimonas kalidii TaxID=3042025 RepID=A0ABT6JSX8_9GAMM|nr:HAD family hydrolase [Luteimonas kalidii]MDH5833578.1 HAD family hydrolase [Luteimonas kalidii]